MKESEIRGLYKAYNTIYNDSQKEEFYEQSSEIYNDLLEFCLFEGLFDTVEEIQYFVEELIDDNLVEEFVTDTLQYYGYGANEIALYESKGKLAVSALRGVINALSSAGRTKAGLSAATALGKSGNILKGSAASTSIRSARSAAKASIPAMEKAGKYLDMLKSMRDKQGKLFNPEGKPYNFRSKAGQEWGGPRATDIVPVRSSSRNIPTTSTSSRTSPGQMEIDFNPRSSPTPRSSSVQSSRQGMPFRATGPGGDARTQRLSQQSTQSSSTRSTVSGLRSSDAKRGARSSTASAVGAIGAASGLTPGLLKKDTTAKSKPVQTDVYNTMDPNGRIRSRKKVGPRLVGNTFEDAFREARNAGKKTFKYGKGEFTTKLANEQTDIFDTILEYLVSEGYADTNETAITIMANMSEEWRQSIIEAKVDEKLPEHERSAARLKRYDNPSGALALGGGQQRARREEHKERRGVKGRE